MRLLSVTIIVSLLGGTAFADEPASTDDVYACAAITEDAARLSCYDDAVGRLKAAEDAGEVATVTRAEVEQVQRDSFGFSIPSLPRLAMPRFGGDDDSGKLEELQLAVKSVRLSPYKKVIVTLENGQVWEQIDTTSIRISRKKPPQKALVKSAALGSYRMKLDGGRLFRVKRIK